MTKKCRCLGWFPDDLNPMMPVTVEILMNEFGRHPWNLKLDDAQGLMQVIQKVHDSADLDMVDTALEYANTVLGGSGVEALYGSYVDSYYHDLRLLYVNQGDSYATTLLYDTKYSQFGITSWGDWIEWAEATGEMPRETEEVQRDDYADTWTPERRMRRTRGKLPG